MMIGFGWLLDSSDLSLGVSRAAPIIRPGWGRDTIELPAGSRQSKPGFSRLSDAIDARDGKSVARAQAFSFSSPHPWNRLMRGTVRST